MSAQKLCAGTVSGNDTQGGGLYGKVSRGYLGLAKLLVVLLGKLLAATGVALRFAAHNPNYTAVSRCVHSPACF
jgi:hypothetical protein